MGSAVLVSGGNIMRQFILAIVTGVVFGLGSAVTFGHGKMLKSEPANGEIVTTAPNSITFRFAAALRLTVVKIINRDDGREIEPTTALGTGPSKTYAIEVPALASGSYQVNWTAVASDGHVMNSSFEFAVRTTATVEK